MAESEQFTQPDTVSEFITKYLDITAPRAPASPRRRARTPAEQEPAPWWPVLDNSGLPLDEGNDFA